MADSGSAKSNQRNRVQAAAGRLAHLRNARFVLDGFKSNAPVPGLPEARKMAADNARRIAAQRPTPSVSA